MGAPSGGQGAGRYINASAPTLNYNAPQGFDPSLVVDTLPGSYVRNKTRVGNYRDPNARIEAARQNSPYDTLEKMTRPDGGIYYQGTRQVVNPQQPIMPNIPVAQNNLNFAAPTNTVRQYAPLTVPQQLKTETTREVLPMSYVPSNRGRGGPSLDQRTETARVSGGYDTLVPQTEQYWVNSRSRGGRGGGYVTRQTGWVGTKQTPTSMINDLMLASNAFTPAPVPTVLPAASAPADGLGRFLGGQATGGNIATGRPTGGK